MAVEPACIAVELRANVPVVTKEVRIKDAWTGIGERRDEESLSARLVLVLLSECGLKAGDTAMQRLGRPLKRCFKLLRSCGLGLEDLEVMTAHACVYFSALVRQLRAASAELDGAELMYIFCVLLFIAHSYVEDRHCPLRYWHNCAFKSYCELSTLNAAILETMRKLDYRLRVPPEELQLRLSMLRTTQDQPRSLLGAVPSL